MPLRSILPHAYAKHIGAINPKKVIYTMYNGPFGQKLLGTAFFSRLVTFNTEKHFEYAAQKSSTKI